LVLRDVRKDEEGHITLPEQLFIRFVEMMSIEELTLWIGLAETVVSSLAYPLSIFGVFWLFRKPLRNLIGRVKEGEFAGNKVSFRQQQVSEVAEKLDKRFDSFKNKLTALGDTLDKLQIEDDEGKKSIESARQLRDDLQSDAEDLNYGVFQLEQAIKPAPSLTDDELDIVHAIDKLNSDSSKGPATSSKIAENANVSYAYLNKILRALIFDGYIDGKKEPNTDHYYYLLDKGKHVLKQNKAVIDIKFRQSLRNYLQRERLKEFLSNNPPPDVDWLDRDENDS